jgi:hypothetical protein
MADVSQIELGCPALAGARELAVTPSAGRLDGERGRYLRHPDPAIPLWRMVMGWNLNDLTARTSAPLAIFSPSGYMFANEGTQHVVYQGRSGDGSGDGHVHELWWQNVWHHSDLTASTGAPLVSGEPSGYAFENQNTQHVVYQGFVAGQGDDGHIHELWRDDDWHHNDLTVASQPHASRVINNPVGYAFFGQTQDVVYEGANSHIHHLWWDGAWHSDDLTAATGAGVLALLPPTAYAFKSQNTRHVVYLGTDGHVHELWWDSSGWHHNDLTATAGAPVASDQPTGFAFDAGDTQLVHYRGTDGHIHQLWWHGAVSPVWHHLDLTATVGGPVASPSRPTGYALPFDGTLHVDYLGSDGHIHEFWRDSSGWHHNDLTARTGAPLAISNPSGYAFESQNTQHVVFTADNHHIIELFWMPS